VRYQRKIRSQPAGPFPFANDCHFVADSEAGEWLFRIDVDNQVYSRVTLVFAKSVWRPFDGQYNSGRTRKLDLYDAASRHGAG